MQPRLSSPVRGKHYVNLDIFGDVVDCATATRNAFQEYRVSLRSTERKRPIRRCRGCSGIRFDRDSFDSRGRLAVSDIARSLPIPFVSFSSVPVLREDATRFPVRLGCEISTTTLISRRPCRASEYSISVELHPRQDLRYYLRFIRPGHPLDIDLGNIKNYILQRRRITGSRSAAPSSSCSSSEVAIFKPLFLEIPFSKILPSRDDIPRDTILQNTAPRNIIPRYRVL